MKKFFLTSVYYFICFVIAYAVSHIFTLILYKINEPNITPENALGTLFYGILPIILTPFLGLIIGLFTRVKAFQKFGFDK